MNNYPFKGRGSDVQVGLSHGVFKTGVAQLNIPNTVYCIMSKYVLENIGLDVNTNTI